MNFEPFNRHIVVDLIEKQGNKKDKLVVLPTDYKKPESPYVEGIVIQVAPDSKFHKTLNCTDKVLIERRMLQKVDINDYSFYLVLENYVYGRINK